MDCKHENVCFDKVDNMLQCNNCGGTVKPAPCQHPNMKREYAGYKNHMVNHCPDCGFEEVDFI